MHLRHLLAMSLVTLFAIAVMLATGTKLFTGSDDPADPPTKESAARVTPATVRVLRVESGPTEIIQRYSGMIRPWERMTLAFEIPGRIERLGQTADGTDLDVGHRVSKDDLIANLQANHLQARKAEADAVLVQAKREHERSLQLRQRSQGAVSETELLDREIALRIAESRAQLASEQLNDATLAAPMDGVISKRHLLAGESVNAHQPVFELIQVDRVRLVVGVPESKVPSLLERMRQVQRIRALDGALRERFRVKVQLVGKDAFGKAWPEEETGEVWQISETSDETTGLFDVEIAIPNEDGRFRPGQIAVARIIVDTIEAARVPSHAAIFQGRRGFLYVAQPDGSGGHVAEQFELKEGHYREQDDQLILREFPSGPQQIVVRGQHRLTPGRPLEWDAPERSTDDDTAKADVAKNEDG